MLGSTSIRHSTGGYAYVAFFSCRRYWLPPPPPPLPPLPLNGDEVEDDKKVTGTDPKLRLPV
jgi:hypothetical protein